MSILEGLWFGELQPCETPVGEDRAEIGKWEETLRTHLSQEQWKLFLNYEDAKNHADGIRESVIFARGIRVGAQLMQELMTPIRS